MDVTGKLPDSEAEVSETFLEIAYDFSYQGLHRGDIDDFKGLDIEFAIGLPLLRKYLKNSKKGNIGLASTSGSTYQQILIATKRRFVNSTLNIVQTRYRSGKCWSGPFREFADGYQSVISIILELVTHGWHIYFFIAGLGNTLRALGKQAFLVGHQSSALLKLQVIEIQHLLLFLVPVEYLISDALAKHGGHIFRGNPPAVFAGQLINLIQD